MSENNGPSRIAIPGQLQVGIEHVPIAVAHPTAFAMPIPGGQKFVVVGGLTKLEYAAIQLRAALIAHKGLPEGSSIIEEAQACLLACEQQSQQPTE